MEGFHLTKYQLKKLHTLFEFLTQNNDYFNQKLVSTGWGTLKSTELLFKSLPVMDKKEIRDNFDYYISKTSEKHLIEMTSGTTGIPLKCIKTEREKSRIGLQMWKERRKWDPCVNPNNFMEMMNKGYKTIGDFTNFDSENLKKCFEKAMQMNPRWLCGPITVVERCARLIQKGVIEYKKGSIKFIEFQGEYVDIERREYIETVFGCKTINHYGIRECWAIAFECPYRQMHILDSLFIVEIVNKGKYRMDVDMGEIVVTSLYNQVMPIVRYNVGDVGNISNTDCDCGNSSPVLTLSGGRTNSTVLGSNDILGDVFFKRIIVKAMNKDHDVIERYRIEQTGLNDFIIYLQKGLNYTEQTSQKIIELIKQRMSSETKVEIVFTTTFPIFPSGKMSTFERKF